MPKVVDHEKVKKDILDGCFELFCRKGYADVTIREIARELKISTGMLYHYFPTKRAILESLFFSKRVTDISELSEEIGEDADREEVIARFMERWETNQRLYQNLQMLAIDFFRSNDCTPDMDVFTHFMDFYATSISSYFQVEEEMGRFIVLYLMGLFTGTLIIPGTVDLHRQLELFGRILNAQERIGPRSEKRQKRSTRRKRR